MENQAFIYQYSAKKNSEVEKIRKKYMPREENKLERLKSLDREAQGAGTIESLALGIIGTLIFGVGMCFGLGALNGADWLAFLLGVLGTLVMLTAYPIYKHISRKTKARLTPEILRLSDEIINNNGF